MRICFQSDLKDCPDLRHAGQRLLSVNPISDNPTTGKPGYVVYALSDNEPPGLVLRSRGEKADLIYAACRTCKTFR